MRPPTSRPYTFGVGAAVVRMAARGLELDSDLLMETFKIKRDAAQQLLSRLRRRGLLVPAPVQPPLGGLYVASPTPTKPRRTK